MSTAARFRCDVCGEEFDTQAEAKKCERKPKAKSLAKVGDIVLTHQGFGWFDGKRAWVENMKRIGVWDRGKKCPNGDSNCFSPCCCYQFFYVITAIDYTRGRWRYHLKTRAMTKGYSEGWTMPETHFGFDIATNVPAAVRAEATAMIGPKSERLL